MGGVFAGTVFEKTAEGAASAETSLCDPGVLGGFSSKLQFQAKVCRPRGTVTTTMISMAEVGLIHGRRPCRIIAFHPRSSVAYHKQRSAVAPLIRLHSQGIRRETWRDLIDCVLGIVFCASAILISISLFAGNWPVLLTAIAGFLLGGGLFVQRWKQRGVFSGL